MGVNREGATNIFKVARGANEIRGGYSANIGDMKGPRREGLSRDAEGPTQIKQVRRGD